MEKLNKSLGEKRPSDPGNGSSLVLDRMNEQMRSVISQLGVGVPSKPLVSPDGIALIMVCAREQKNVAQQSPSEIADNLLNERVEQTSRTVRARSGTPLRHQTAPERSCIRALISPFIRSDPSVTNAATFPPLRQAIEQHGLSPRKSLGQHFLLDRPLSRASRNWRASLMV